MLCSKRRAYRASLQHSLTHFSLWTASQNPIQRKKMEHVEALSEGEWSSSFSGMFSTDESDFMAQLLGNYSAPNEQEPGSTLTLGTLSSLWPGQEGSAAATATGNATGSDESTYYCSDGTANSSLICYPQGSSYSSGTSSSLLLPSPGHHGHYYLSHSNPILVSNSSSMSMDFSMVNPSIQVFAENPPMEEGASLNEEMSSESGASPETTITLRDKKLQQLKRRSMMPEPNVNTEDKSEYQMRKKSRVPADVQRAKKNVQLKKTHKLNLNSNDEDDNTTTNGQSSSSDCSEDDSNASQEQNGGGATSSSKGSASLNLKGKTRASRGSATDPQSLYARKRRERINERLRILQNLVPNGTKVDISTMLEEAVQYVKFLQLQIKLLSSDDLWMYAPIAYNGMDIGLDLKISASRC